MRFILCRHGKHVHISEPVVCRIERIHAVQKRFHLPAHLVIVDRGHKHQCVRIPDLFRNQGGVILQHARLRLLACKTASAEPDGFALQADLLYLVSRISGSGNEPVRQDIRIAFCPQACSNHQNAAHFTYTSQNLQTQPRTSPSGCFPKKSCPLRCRLQLSSQAVSAFICSHCFFLFPI